MCSFATITHCETSAVEIVERCLRTGLDYQLRAVMGLELELVDAAEDGREVLRRSGKPWALGCPLSPAVEHTEAKPPLCSHLGRREAVSDEDVQN